MHDLSSAGTRGPAKQRAAAHRKLELSRNCLLAWLAGVVDALDRVRRHA